MTRVNAIASFGLWYTEGHGETGGDDSITHVQVGKKLIFIVERGYHSRILDNSSKLLRRELNFYRNGFQ